MNKTPKRANFASIQQSSGTFAKGYRTMPLRTGYERVIASRVDELYAVIAKEKGKIVDVTDRAVVVEYAGGRQQSYPIGRQFGVAAGVTYPHTLTTGLKVGDRVKPGDCISYNEHYFSLDPLNRSSAIWKSGVIVRTALLECSDTLEDSSVISEEVAAELETQITKVREIVVSFDQVIHNLVEPGISVDTDSILCTIEDAVTAQSKLFDETSLDTLRLIAANTPRAKFQGKVEKIEVFYHGDFDDLSESLKNLAQQSDLERKRVSRALGKKYTSGKVDDSMRIDGNALAFENVVIRVFITGDMPASVGDKGVFGNQLKTIFGRVMSGRNETESGLPLGALFGYISVSARIVQSPEIIGTTNVLLRLIGERAVAAYRK